RERKPQRRRGSGRQLVLSSDFLAVQGSKRSEVDLQPDLLAPAEVDRAARVAEVGVAPGSDEVVQAAVARPVEGVEDLADDADREAAPHLEVLLQVEVDRAVREAPGLRRIDRAVERARLLARRQV